MKYSFRQLVDIPQLQTLMDELFKAAGIPLAVVAMDGEILTGSGWQPICTDFHRRHPDIERECIQSDIAIRKAQAEGAPFAMYQCPRGLVDASAPVIIEGEHVANVFAGQVFLEPPDARTEADFREQARRFGFIEEEYLAAMRKVPVFPEEKFRAALAFLAGMAEMLAQTGLTRLREMESGETLRISRAEQERSLAEADRSRQVLLSLLEDQARTAAALGESERQYALLAENISDVIWIMDLETGRFRFVSPSVVKLRGYSVEEVMAQPLEDTMTADSLERIWGGLPERMESYRKGKRESYIDEVEQPCKDGRSVWTEVTTQYRPDEEGRILVYGVSRDITERKSAEQDRHVIFEALKESEERYRLLVDNAAEAIYVAQDGRLKYANRKTTEASGHPMDALLTQSFLEFVHPDDRARSAEHHRRLMAGETGLPAEEFRMLHKDGTVRWVVLNATPIAWEGKPASLNFLTDVTERKQAEHDKEAARAELQASEELFRGTFDQAAVGMSILTAEGRWLQVNHRLCDILGFSAEELLSQDYTQLTHPDHVAADVERVRQMVAGARSADSWEKRYIRKDGRIIWARITTALIRDPQGAPVYHRHRRH